MSAPSAILRRASWLTLALGLLLALGLQCANWRQVFPGDGTVNFVDADCYARMTRAAEIAAHPGRIIRWHTFENYPFGVRPHTTAPLDYLIAALRVVFWSAPDLAGAWVSPLLGVATAAGLWLWAQRERLPGAAIMLLIFGGSPILAQGFALGRPDHQSLELACLAAALAAEWAQWRAPSRGWGLIAGAAWALALWTSLYEPLIVLATMGVATACFHRAAFRERERLPGLILGGVMLAGALAAERLTVRFPGESPYFAAWAQSIGELRSVPPWSPTLYGWTGRALLIAPFLLWRRGAAGRAHLLMLLTMFALTCWQVRWGYFLALVYVISLPEQLAAFLPVWRGWAAVAIIGGLWPMATEWSGRLAAPSAEVLEQREDTALLRETAAFIAKQGGAEGGILAPWWLSPALAYWSGGSAVAGSSHESLPGTVDAARFYLADDPAEIAAILRARRVRWVVAYEPERVFQTATPLLGRRPTPRSMGVILYNQPEAAPRGLRLAMVNKFFKVYEATSP